MLSPQIRVHARGHALAHLAVRSTCMPSTTVDTVDTVAVVTITELSALHILLVVYIRVFHTPLN